MIEPEYLLLTDFICTSRNLAIAAKIVDGEVRFGAIDTDGNTVIPFEYADLNKDFSDSGFVFKHYSSTSMGFVDANGKVIMEPTFENIYRYLPDRRLVVASEDGVNVGLYSLDKNEFIIPPTYATISIIDGTAKCELYEDEECYEYYDLDGNSTQPPKVQNEFEITNGENGYKGVRDKYGNQIIPNEYYDITIHDHFFIAEYDHGTRSRLFTKKGELVLGDGYSCIEISHNKVYADTENTTRVFEITA